MRHIYDFVNRKIEKKDQKYTRFLTLNMAVFALAGLILWALVGRLVMAGVFGIFCFMGYPMFFAGFLGGILYIYNLGDSAKKATCLSDRQEDKQASALRAGLTY